MICGWLCTLASRASTEDQARNGISIEAQLATLHEWAKRENHIVVGEYVDAGISGKKPPSKRPELSRFFADIESGLKVDVLAFAKLDRFFRSVKLYYQAVDVLDRHHIAWQAIQEDYETVTASGRMKVNIMLSVAENEADRTSERIKTVFEHKIEKGEAITRCQPFGFEVRDKKVVPNEYAPAALEAFQMFADTGNTYAVRDMIQTKYGVRLPYEAVYRFLQNPMYKGQYRDNPNYCQPIVSSELFDRVQADFAERRKTKKTPSGRIYLFSGLLICKECGRRMTVSPGSKGSLHPERYRCPGHLMGKTCGNNRTVTEYEIETYLLDTITKAVASAEFEYKVSEKKTPTVNKSAVKQKLSRLKELYIDGDITKEEYTAQKQKITSILTESQTQPTKPRLQVIIGDDFAEYYTNSDKTQKRSFWRNIIDHIVFDRNKNMDVFFIS